MTFKSLLLPTLLICNGLLAQLSIASIANPSEVQTQHVVNVKSDSDKFPGLCKLDIVRQADGKIVSIVYTSAKDEVTTIPVSKLLSHGEQPLLTSDFYGTVLFINLEKDFDVYKGGHGNVRFVTNVITRNKKDFRILVQVGNEVTFRSDPNSSDSASDKNPYSGQFNFLFVQTKGAAGIKALIPSNN